MKTDTCGKAKGMYGNHIHPYWKRVSSKAERRNAKREIFRNLKNGQ